MDTTGPCRRGTKAAVTLSPNGVTKSKHYVLKTPQTSEAVLNANHHLISYILNRNQAVIVEYQKDNSSDMFQIDWSKF